MNRVRVGSTYVYDPVPWDQLDPPSENYGEGCPRGKDWKERKT